MASITPSHFFKHVVAPHYGNIEMLASIHKSLWNVNDRKIYHLVNAIAAIGGESNPSTKPAVIPCCAFELEDQEILSKKELTGKRLVVIGQKFLADHIGETKYSLAKPKIAEFGNEELGKLYADLFLLDPHLRYTILRLVSRLVDTKTVMVHNEVPSSCNNYVIYEVDELLP